MDSKPISSSHIHHIHHSQKTHSGSQQNLKREDFKTILQRGSNYSSIINKAEDLIKAMDLEKKSDIRSKSKDLLNTIKNA